MRQDPGINKQECLITKNDPAIRGREEGEFNIRVNSVGLGGVQPVGDEDTSANGEDVDVEVVVDQVELLAGCERACGSVDFTRELAIRRIVFVFPKLSDWESADVRRRNHREGKGD
jgi:hypothetical protein